VSLFPSLQTLSRDGAVLTLVGAIFVALVVTYILNKILGRLGGWFLSRARRDTYGDALLERRRAETLLNVVAAVGRTIILFICLYVAWRISSPHSNTPVALIGAGTFFIVIGGVTVGPLLRDITNGILMILEGWYNVGDHITIDPFTQLSGIVERLNLRSTKMRSLNGEVIWVHNQYIQAVRVTPRGLRTISIDTFVTDPVRGRKLLERTFAELPVGPAMIVSPLAIIEEEEHGGVWRITATGQTTPGREWLIEDFAVNAVKQANARGTSPVIVYGPIVRYTDATAEQRFERSMQTSNHAKRPPRKRPRKKTP
jgi:hypothetical protein